MKDASEKLNSSIQLSSGVKKYIYKPQLDNLGVQSTIAS